MVTAFCFFLSSRFSLRFCFYVLLVVLFIDSFLTVLFFFHTGRWTVGLFLALHFYSCWAGSGFLFVGETGQFGGVPFVFLL
jgi:hypothetical protein